jgi:hypothetical protein
MRAFRDAFEELVTEKAFVTTYIQAQRETEVVEVDDVRDLLQKFADGTPTPDLTQRERCGRDGCTPDRHYCWDL